VSAGVNIFTAATITFNKLHVSTDDDWGMLIAGSGGGVVRVLDAGSTVDAEGWPAIEATNLVLDMTFSDVSATNSSGDGIRLQGTTGMFSATGGFLTNNADRGVALFLGSTVFSYDGSITTPVGSGRSVIISNNSGSSTFNGLVQERGQGILLSSNDPGAKTVFQGGLDIDVSGGLGFNAGSAGGIEVTGFGNTIDAVGQSAIDISDSSIGPAGVTFESISADGGGTGIMLLNVEGPGNFTVTGTGGPGSGGLIQNTTGPSVKMENAENPSLFNLDIVNSGGPGIRLVGTKNGTLDGVTIDGTGVNSGAVEDRRGIDIHDVTGTFTFDNIDVTNAGTDGIAMFSPGGGDRTLNINSSSVTMSGQLDALIGTGVWVGASTVGSGMTTVTVTATTLASNSQSGLHGATLGTQELDLRISSSPVTGNGFVGVSLHTGESGTTTGRVTSNPNIDSNGNSSIELFHNGGTSNFDFSGNGMMGNAAGVQVYLATGTGPGQINGFIRGNNIDGTTFPGTGGAGVFISADGSPGVDILVENNDISGMADGATGGVVGFFSFNGASTNSSNFLVTNNRIDMPGTASGDGIHFGVGGLGTLCASLNGVGNQIGVPGGGDHIFGGGFTATSTLNIQGLPGFTTVANDVEDLFEGQNHPFGLPGSPLSPGNASWVLDGTAGANPGTCQSPIPLP